MKKKLLFIFSFAFIFEILAENYFYDPLVIKINSAFDFLFMNRAWFQISLNIHMELFTPNR